MSVISRAVRPSVAAAASTFAAPSAVSAAGSAVRNMATLRELETRVKSVRNIEKITKSMKMIASTKLNKAQRAMQAAKVYGVSNSEVFKNAEAVASEGGRILYVVVSSDKGLCGGIHSSVTKAYKAELVKASGKDSKEAPKVIVLGEKSKAQLARAAPQQIAMSFNQLGKDVPTFADACAIADTIVKSGVEYDNVQIIYNRFVSALSYEPAKLEAFNEEALRNAPNFKAYEQEDDVTRDLVEFSLANAIYAALAEGHAAEINAKRNAMDNASKNAGDMIVSLQMQYNRGRQATITAELVDIITGASAL